MPRSLAILLVLSLAASVTAPRRAQAVWGLDTAADAVKSTWKSGVDKLKGKPKAPTDPNDPVSLSTKIKPPTSDYYVSLAKLHEKANKPDLARVGYEKALKMDPGHEGAMIGLARLNCSEKKWTEAAKIYTDALKQHPHSAITANDAGLCYAALGRMPEATAALRKAVELEPTREMYRNNLANVLIRQGQLEAALGELLAVHGPAVAHYNAGYLLQQTGQMDQATIQFQRSLQADPMFEPSKRWLASLETARGGPSLAAQDAPVYTSPTREIPTYTPQTREMPTYRSPTAAAANQRAYVPRARLNAQPRLPSQIAQESGQYRAGGAGQDARSAAPTPDTVRSYRSGEGSAQPNYRQVEMLPPVTDSATPRRY